MRFYVSAGRRGWWFLLTGRLEAYPTAGQLLTNSITITTISGWSRLLDDLGGRLGIVANLRRAGVVQEAGGCSKFRGVFHRLRVPCTPGE